MNIDWLQKIECSFSEVAGVVVDANHITKTDIYNSHKTEGYVGYVAIKTSEVHAVHTDENKFWIQTPAGEQVYLTFQNLKYPPTVGQSVVLLSAKVAQNQFVNECSTALVNKSARKVDYLYNPLSPLKLRFEMDFTFTKYLVYLFCLWGGAVSLGAIWNGMVITGFLFLLFCLLVTKVSLNKIVPYISKYFKQNKDLNNIARRAFTELKNETAARCKEILER